MWQQATSISGGTTTTTDVVYALGLDEITTTAVTGYPTLTTDTWLYDLPGGGFATRDSSGLN